MDLQIPSWANTKKIRSIDHYMVYNFLNYKFQFISFFLKHKVYFSNKIQEIFNTYFSIFLINNQNDFNAARELYKFLLDNINKKSYGSTEITENIVIKKNNINFSEKYRDGFYYNYKRDNLYKKKYFISNNCLLSYLFKTIEKNHDLKDSIYDNILKIFIESEIYDTLSKVKILNILLSFPDFFNQIKKIKYWDIPNKPPKKTLIGSLLYKCEDSKCHNTFYLIYELLCRNRNFKRLVFNYLKKYIHSIDDFLNPQTLKYHHMFMLYLQNSKFKNKTLSEFTLKSQYDYVNLSIKDIRYYEQEISKIEDRIDAMPFRHVLIKQLKKQKTEYIKKKREIQNSLHIENNEIFLLFKKSVTSQIQKIINNFENNDLLDNNDKDTLINNTQNIIDVIIFYNKKFCINLKNITETIIQQINLQDIFNEEIETPFKNPHFLTKIINLFYFLYPKYPLKRTYKFIINFYIYFQKNPQHWLNHEKKNLEFEIHYLISRYSRNTEILEITNEKVNIQYIHCLLKNLIEINTGLEKLLSYAKEDIENNISENLIKKYFRKSKYQERKKEILKTINRHFKTELIHIYFKDSIFELFISTINFSFFRFLPFKLHKNTEVYNIVKEYFLIDKDRVYYNYIYENIYNYNFEKKRKGKIENITERALSKTIEEPIYFDIDVLKQIHEEKMDDFLSKKLYLYCVEQINAQIDEIDYDDEFLDPIMTTVIENPVFLPNTDVLMDRKIIERHLLNSNTNPFTRDKLTLNELNQYNQKKEIIEKQNKFLEKKQNFIEKHKK